MTQHAGNTMQAKTGKLEGKGQIIGPDGKVKSEFTISSDVTEEQAAALQAEANKQSTFEA